MIRVRFRRRGRRRRLLGRKQWFVRKFRGEGVYVCIIRDNSFSEAGSWVNWILAYVGYRFKGLRVSFVAFVGTAGRQGTGV
jgi:hypothetical protein